ncbi:MAG: TIGR01212 family radical SAM protein [Clostridia bacterium]|nr:TIGR01212 family radical SAM protein [Clostridia bacterium]
MKKTTQREENPFPFSDTNKRYHTFDYYLKKRFGGKCAKISLDAGFTCPNIDGTVGYGGCIYCSGGSSGAQCVGSLREQYDAGIAAAKRKWNCERFIPYLQAHTNTYGDIATLERVYDEAQNMPGAVMLAIATRADCLPEETVELLKKTSEKIPLLVELGLQSANDRTAELVGRGHDFSAFTEGYNRLKCAGGDISVCVHLINGLPEETKEDMLESAERVALLRPHMVKIHLLHVLRNTRLGEMYEKGEYEPMTEEEYINITAAQIERFHPETVIARVTGDGMAEELVAPLWSLRKTAVSNGIDKRLYAENTCQGADFQCKYS